MTREKAITTFKHVIEAYTSMGWHFLARDVQSAVDALTKTEDNAVENGAVETGTLAATKPPKPRKRRGVVTVKCTGGSPSNLGIKYEATAEVEELERIGAYSRLKVITVAGNMDRAEVQEMAALVPTEKVTWVDKVRASEMPVQQLEDEQAYNDHIQEKC